MAASGIITDVDQFTEPVRAPADGDPANGETFQAGLQDLANRTRNLKNRLDNSRPAIEVITAASGTWTKDPEAVWIEMLVVGSGASGSGGAAAQGGSGGGSGRIARYAGPASMFPDTLSYSVGQSVAGGAANTVGNAGQETVVTGTNFELRAAGGGVGTQSAGGAGYSGGGGGGTSPGVGGNGGSAGRSASGGGAGDLNSLGYKIGGPGGAGGGGAGGGGGGGGGPFLGDPSSPVVAESGQDGTGNPHGEGGGGGVGYGAGGGGGGAGAGGGGTGGASAPGVFVVIQFF